MSTECNASPIEFVGLGRRQVVASFDGGDVTSDGGLLLLREVAEHTGLLEKFAACFDDYRDPTRIEYTVQELVSQRVMGIACGYEDLVDHETLRKDPLFAVAAGKKDVQGKNRRSRKDQGLRWPVRARSIAWSSRRPTRMPTRATERSSITTTPSRTSSSRPFWMHTTSRQTAS